MLIRRDEIELSEGQKDYVAHQAEAAGKPWRAVLDELVPAVALPGAVPDHSGKVEERKLPVLLSHDEWLKRFRKFLSHRPSTNVDADVSREAMYMDPPYADRSDDE